MKTRLLLLAVLAVLLAFPVAGLAQQGSGNPNSPKPPDAGKNPLAATPNLSFPIIATDIIQMFYQQIWVDDDLDEVKDDNEWYLGYDTDGDGTVDTNVWAEGAVLVPIEVTEVINVQYGGEYPGNDDAEHCAYTLGDDGCPLDINSWDGDGNVVPGVTDGVVDDADLTCVDMVDWLADNEYWYDQPVSTDDSDPNLIWNADYVDAANSWQADWVRETTNVVYIDFIDWGNPLENINPIVGQRFPVEVALYKLLDAPMTAYNMACLEYPGTKVELFGTSEASGSFTYESAFATVLTNMFIAEVHDPSGGITAINLGPGIGPSGKMNFASGGGGWTPKMPGWHRIWLHLNDPLISLSGAIVNNDEHYIMTSGCMAQTLNPNKLELTGIIGDSTFIDVLVVTPSGNH